MRTNQIRISFTMTSRHMLYSRTAALIMDAMNNPDHQMISTQLNVQPIHSEIKLNQFVEAS